MLLGEATWDCVCEGSPSNCRKVTLGNQDAKPNKGKKMNLNEISKPQGKQKHLAVKIEV